MHYFFTFQLPLKCSPLGSQHVQKSSASYFQIVKDRQFIIPCVQGGLGFATIVTLQEVSPFIFQHELQLSSQIFGLFGLAIGVTYFFGSLYVKRNVKKLGSQTLMNRGSTIILIGVLLMMTVWLLGDSISLQVLMGGYLILYLVIIFGQAVIFPNSMSLAASNFSHRGAHSIALCGFLQQSMAGVAAILVVIDGHSQSWMYWIMVMGIIIFGLSRIQKHKNVCLS